MGFELDWMMVQVSAKETTLYSYYGNRVVNRDNWLVCSSSKLGSGNSC